MASINGPVFLSMKSGHYPISGVNRLFNQSCKWKKCYMVNWINPNLSNTLLSPYMCQSYLFCSTDRYEKNVNTLDLIITKFLLLSQIRLIVAFFNQKNIIHLRLKVGSIAFIMTTYDTLRLQDFQMKENCLTISYVVQMSLYGVDMRHLWKHSKQSKCGLLRDLRQMQEDAGVGGLFEDSVWVTVCGHYTFKWELPCVMY